MGYTIGPEEEPSDPPRGQPGAFPLRSTVNPAVTFKVHEEYVAWARKDLSAGDRGNVGGEQLPFLPHSLCFMVPPAVACVQPKASTPSVGCTLRSLTHHLALLPPIGNVTTFWKLAVKPDDRPAPFNILVIPYPFSLPGRAFSPTRGAVANSGDRAFNISPEAWTGNTTPSECAAFVIELVEEARREMETVNAVLLPEGALPMAFADAVASEIAKSTQVELFLTGATSVEEGSARNLACLFRLLDGEVIEHSFQSKHHR